MRWWYPATLPAPATTTRLTLSTAARSSACSHRCGCLARYAAGMAEPGERAFAGAALEAVVKQANAAMRAKVDRGIFQIHRPLAAGAHTFGQPRERRLVA